MPPVRSQHVPHRIRSLARTILLIPERSAAVLELLVLLQVERRAEILVVLERTIIVERRGSIVGKEVEAGAVRRERRDCRVAGGVGPVDILQGLVARVDESRSVQGALQPRLFHVPPRPLPLASQVRERQGVWGSVIKNRPLDVVFDGDRAEFFHLEPLDEIRVGRAQAMVEANVLRKPRERMAEDLMVSFVLLVLLQQVPAPFHNQGCPVAGSLDPVRVVSKPGLGRGRALA